MHYSIIVYIPVATSYGLAYDRWEFPRCNYAETLSTIATAEAHGWDHILSVSLTKEPIWQTTA